MELIEGFYEGFALVKTSWQVSDLDDYIANRSCNTVLGKLKPSKRRWLIGLLTLSMHPVSHQPVGNGKGQVNL